MKIGLNILVGIIILFGSNCVQSQNDDNKIIDMLREFYIKYNSVWMNESYSIEKFEEQLFSLQKIYCSERMQIELRQYYNIYRFEHDLITNDFGGSDEESFRSTLSISKYKENTNTYIVSYMVLIDHPSAPRKEKNAIHVKVIQEGENYKIDEIIEP